MSCVHGGRKILLRGRSSEEERLFRFTGRNFGLCGAQIEKELMMTGDKRTLLLSALALITPFQQSYHNYQLVLMPNEMVSLAMITK